MLSMQRLLALYSLILLLGLTVASTSLFSAKAQSDIYEDAKEGGLAVMGGFPIGLATIIGGVSVGQNQITSEWHIGNQSFGKFYDNYTPDQYQTIIQNCIDHADKIQMGENPVQVLVDTGLIPKWFNNKTCADVQQENDNFHKFSNALDALPDN